jgi:large subunit ribosomal protein L6
MLIIPQNTTVFIRNNILRFAGIYGSAYIIFRSSKIFFSKKKAIEAYIQTKISGLSIGYVKRLVISGVGYKFFVGDNFFIFIIGYSHPVKVKIPSGISFVGDEKAADLVLWSNNFQKLAFFVAKLTKIKKKDPYKGKGIRDNFFFFVKKEIKKK